VRDRIAEVGINLNTVFTALVLSGILWVGTTLRDISTDLRTNAIQIAIIGKEVATINAELERHRVDAYVHQKTHAGSRP
jgi:hypothetical protein